jgi:hypothetical protein
VYRGQCFARLTSTHERSQTPQSIQSPTLSHRAGHESVVKNAEGQAALVVDISELSVGQHPVFHGDVSTVQDIQVGEDGSETPPLRLPSTHTHPGPAFTSVPHSAAFSLPRQRWLAMHAP